MILFQKKGKRKGLGGLSPEKKKLLKVGTKVLQDAVVFSYTKQFQILDLKTSKLFVAVSAHSLFLYFFFFTF